MLYIGIFTVIGQYAMYIDLALAGIQNKTKNSGGELFLNAIVFYFVFKRLNLKPYVGAIVGVLAWFIVAVVASVLATKFAH